MKSLYESILGTNSAGIEARIKEWCDAHDIYSGDYVIGKDKKIYKRSQSSASKLILDYSDYDELPDYINFGHCDRATLVLGQRQSKRGSFEPLPTIKSFRGIPDEAFAVIVRPMKNNIIPKLDIKTPKFTLLCVHLTKGSEKLNIDASNSNTISKISLSPDSYHGFDYNIDIKGKIDELYFRDDAMEEEFAKLIRGKAPMNKKVPRPDDQPLTPEAQNIVNSFFVSHGINIDMKNLKRIDYVQASTLDKGKDGLWYRRPGGY